MPTAACVWAAAGFMDTKLRCFWNWRTKMERRKMIDVDSGASSSKGRDMRKALNGLLLQIQIAG